jgi:hypothetical protein
VRIWWALSLGVLAVTLWVAAIETKTWWSERQLLSSGRAVTGTIVRAQTPENDMTVPGRSMAPDSQCTIEFELDGRNYRVVDVLRENVERGLPVVTGSQITLHVDPTDPMGHWTARTSTPPLAGRQLIGIAVGAPVVFVLAVIALMKRRRMLTVWTAGTAEPARVLGVGHSPVAPRSRALRCTSANARDSRVITVFVPAAAISAAVGDVLWVIRHPDKPESAIAASWFERDAERALASGTATPTTSVP